MKENFIISSAVILALAFIFPSSATAQEFTLNQRIDHAIYLTHEPEIVLAGQIIRKDTVSNPPAKNAYQREITLQFKVSSVIWGDAAYLGKTLPVSVTSFWWPDDLLPCEQEVNCVFLFNPNMLHVDTKTERYYIDTVVPTRANIFPPAKDGAEAKNILEDEILAELAVEKDVVRQRALLRQVAPILESKHLSDVEPFVSSPDVWVKRAALAAAIYATEKDKFVRLAAPDIQNFFATTKSTDLLEGRYAAYPYFFNYYFFLEKRSWTWGSRWDEAEATKNLRIVDALVDTGLISPEIKQQLMSREKR